MHYSSFRIQNFKGIKDTTVVLSDQTKMGVFAFVGLNESGKTTILEAIHSFSPDHATGELVGGDASTGVPYKNRVPRHLISIFSGNVSVTATVKVSDEDKKNIIKEASRKNNIIVRGDSFPDEIVFERYQQFKQGDFVASFFSLKTKIEIKTGRQNKWRSPDLTEQKILRDLIYGYTPDIAYFPTFVFDFPKKIFLTKERGEKVSNFYRQVFQDIMDYDGQGHTIEESIVRRIRSEDKKIAWLSFLNIWNASDDKDKIQHVVDRASAVVTDVVFGRWNKIFGEDAKGKEINISFETLEGEIKNDSGQIVKTNEHDIFIKFKIKDGTRRFDVNDRSLGFRWFFAFMLFTQFRVARERTRPVFFLFDEPASNLHAAAQQRLIESFPAIAKENHTLAYTTHSHYMIEPRWLEQTFIVTNRTDAPNGSVLSTLSMDDESLDIKATRYKNFINENPSKTSYFQPILDRLDVVPSRFDIKRASIVIEGKSDYYIITYLTQLLGQERLPLMPAMGAGTFSSLISMNIGWNLNMLFILDGDKKGVLSQKKYIDEYLLSDNRVILLSDLMPEIKEIEDVLDNDSLGVIQEKLGLEKRPTKDQIARFFQEALAKDDIISLGEKFLKKGTKLITSLKSRLEEL